MCCEDEDCFGGVIVGTGAQGPQGPVGPIGPQGVPGASGELPELASKLYYYKTLQKQRSFTGSIIDLPVGEWMQNQVAYKVPSLILTNINDPGKYLVNCNLSFGVGSLSLSGNNVVRLNYELRLNGVVIPFSTRNTYRQGGTPEDQTAIDSTVGEAIISAKSDEIEVWVYVDSIQSGVTIPTGSNIVVLQSGTLWAHRLLVTS